MPELLSHYALFSADISMIGVKCIEIAKHFFFNLINDSWAIFVNKNEGSNFEWDL